MLQLSVLKSYLLLQPSDSLLVLELQRVSLDQLVLQTFDPPAVRYQLICAVYQL